MVVIVDEKTMDYVKVLEENAGDLSEEEQEVLKSYNEQCKKNYKVWEVFYDYDVSFDCPNERFTEEYYVVAESIGRAEEKANELFLKDSFKRELFEKGKVRRCIQEYIVDVPFPDLTLEDDVNSFFIEARLSSDGAVANCIIEYEVIPYLVKRK